MEGVYLPEFENVIQWIDGCVSKLHMLGVDSDIRILLPPEYIILWNGCLEHIGVPKHLRFLHAEGGRYRGQVICFTSPEPACYVYDLNYSRRTADWENKFHFKMVLGKKPSERMECLLEEIKSMSGSSWDDYYKIFNGLA